jgi:hypothetical protein
MGGVFQPGLFQHDRDLTPVWGCPSVKIYHSSILSAFF